MTNPLVTFEMENGDTFLAELYPEVAPNTVNNFISLVKKGFYDGLTFHRIIPGFMIQGGDPDGNGTGGPGYGIKGEFASNGFANELRHTEGVLSMARAMDPDSAGSQFFVMAAVHKAENVRTNPWNNRPIRPVVIRKVTVDTRGIDYPEPETI